MLFRLEPREHEGAGCASMRSPLEAASRPRTVKDWRRLSLLKRIACRGSLLGAVTQQLVRVMPLLWPGLGRVPDRESSAASANGPGGHLATGPPRLPPQLRRDPSQGPEDPWCLDQ